MNERQLKAFVKDAFRMDAVAEDALRLADPAFHQAMLRVRQLVGELPSGSLMRQQYWKQIFPQVAQALAPYNQSLRDALGKGLLGEASGMRKQAEGLLRSSGLSIEIPEVTPLAEYTQMVLDTKVNGQRLQSLFSGPGGISPWVRSNARVVDQIVSTGISLGISTNDLADQIATQMVVNGNEVLNFHGPTAARRIRVASRALARTSVQDFNKQIQQETWRDNAQVMKEAGFKFEWVAALDSRTCMICGPLDGEVVDEYEEFDDWPIHVNCRCRVVAIDPDNPFFKTAQRRGTQLSDEPTKGKRGGYATKVKVKGEKFFRRAEAVPSTVKPNYAGWLSKSNHLTQAEAFGGGNAGMFRAARFRTSLKRGVSPDKALKDLLTGRSGGLVPIKKLGPGVAKKAASNKALALPKTPKKVRPDAALKAQLAKKNKEAAAKQAQILGAAEAKKQQAKMDAALKAHEAKQKAADLLAKKQAVAAAKKKAAEQAAAAKAKAEAAAKKKAALAAEKLAATQKAAAAQAKAAPVSGAAVTSNVDYQYDDFAKLGYAKKTELTKAKRAVNSYVKDGYDPIRAAQAQAAIDAGQSVSAYDRAIARQFIRDEGRAELKKWGAKAVTIDDFLGRAPIYKGEIYRGLNFQYQGAVDSFVAQLKTGSPSVAIESWTNNAAHARKFAAGSTNVERGKFRVLVKMQNTKGVPINSLNPAGEGEVLMPSKVRYQVTGVTTRTVNGVNVTEVTVKAGKPKAPAQAKAAAAQKAATAKAKAQATVKATPVVIPPKAGGAQTFYGVNPQAAWGKSPKQVGTGMYGTVVETPAGTVIKRGAITKTEVQALQQLNKSGFTPKLHGVSFLDADWAKTNGFVSRRGFLEMSRAPGDPLYRLFAKTSDKQKLKAHDSLLRARKALHLKGIAHQDMHGANVMLKLDTGQITLIDFGTARLDPRAALIEGLGTKRGKIAFGQVGQAGDYQSRALWQGLNPKNLQASNPVAKLFNANRKRVEAILKAEGHARYIDASIRTLPRGTLSKARALELIEMLYEGI